MCAPAHAGYPYAVHSRTYSSCVRASRYTTLIRFFACTEPGSEHAGDGDAERDCSVTGSSTVNVLPSPSTESTEIVPDMRCTRCFTMLSPSPVPCFGRVSEVSACRNGSKIALRNALGIPQPVSATLIRSCAGPLMVTERQI